MLYIIEKSFSSILVTVSGSLVLVVYGGHRQTTSYDSSSEADKVVYSARLTHIEALNDDGKRKIKNEQSLSSSG